MATPANTKKNFTWNLFGSLINSCTSLFFLIAVTRINGVNEAGIFSFAFSVACILNIIGIYYGRAYQVTETDSRFTDSDFICHHFFTCALMILVAALFLIVKRYPAHKTWVFVMLVAFKAAEAFFESVYAVIQKHNELYKVGISMFLKALFGYGAFLAIDIFTHSLIFAIGGIIAANLAVFLIYDLKNVRPYVTRLEAVDFGKMTALFKAGFFTFLFTLLTQYIINASKFAIDSHMEDKYQTVFGIILMPATLIFLFGQFMIHPFLVRLTDYFAKGKKGKFIASVAKIAGCVAAFGALAVLAAYIAGIPFLEFLYGVKLSKYLYPLIIIIAGATFYAMSTVLSNALIVMRKTGIQSVIYIIAAIAAFFVSGKLVVTMGIMGAALSYALIMLFIFLMYTGVFFVEIKRAPGGNFKNRADTHTGARGGTGE